MIKSKVHWDLEQKTIEWHEMRWAKATASVIKPLMANKQIEETVVFFDLLGQSQEPWSEADWEEPFQSDAMKNGDIMEAEAICELTNEIGLRHGYFPEFLNPGFIEYRKYLGMSPDGITEDQTESCEVKCPEPKKHAMNCMDKWAVPLDHVWQNVMYFVNPKIQRHWFGSYRKRNRVEPLHMKMLERDTKINIGTEKTPKIVTVQKAVDMLMDRYELLESLINTINNK